MKSWNKHKTAILLIFGSLALLLFFLSSWIHTAYVNEKADLHQEISYTFKDIIRNLEDSLIQKVLFTKDGSENIQKTIFKSINGEKIHSLDSFSMIVAFDQAQHETKILDSSQHMVVKTEIKTGESIEDFSLLSLLLSMKDDNHGLAGDNLDFSELIEQSIGPRYEEEAIARGLPNEFDIVKTDVEEDEGGLNVRIYKGAIGKPSIAVFSNYFWHIIRNIRQTLLFSLILFAAISISFHMIYSNWRKQLKLIDIKNDFIGNVTHELKTPIATVNVALEALSQFDVLEDRSKTNEYLELSRKELNRLKILVDRVLKMAIFENGSSQFHYETLSLDELLEDVLSSMKIQFDKMQVIVRTQVNGKDFTIDGDKIHLTNVIYNLLDNAMKYSNEIPEIDIILEEKSGVINLAIKDNGIGIAKEYQAKVFDRFYRIPKGDRHDVKGHGLGLSYVASVIAQHKGVISLDSSLENGSTFYIRLNKSKVGS